MIHLLRSLFATALALCGFFSVSTAPSHADEPTVTRFETTEVIYNACNDELVLVNATLVTETRLTQVGTRTTYSQRTWLEDVTAASDQQSYLVARASVDAFSTAIRKGQTTVKSFQGSLLRLTPTSGSTGRMTVMAGYAFVSNLDTGETQVLYDKYSSSCR